jgi:hypothetical protein
MLTIIALSDAGAVCLSDGSRWVISRDDTWAASAWRPGHHVAFHGEGAYRRLENLDAGNAAEVIQETVTPTP